VSVVQSFDSILSIKKNYRIWLYIFFYIKLGIWWSLKGRMG
jgi:hypothetical protein